MPKKNWTEEERKAFGEKMRQAKLNKEKKVEDIQSDPDTNDILRQLKELQESNALLRAAVLNQEKGTTPVESISLNKGRVIGIVEKYLVDPSAYPDPTERLRKEPRLAPLAFDYNYELEYTVATSNYETKEGINYKEPKFLISLNRIVLDDQGQQTNKRYVARKLIFHEDPQAALVIARDNGIEIDESDERAFLNEMRYLRVRDWLFDVFWPKPADEHGHVTDQVIGGTVVQVFTKKSEDPSEIDFNQLKSKLV